jgi:ribonuclease HII
MAYLIGTDEAGYAPNLGPLVISCTVWHVADQAPCESVAPKQPRRKGKRNAAREAGCQTLDPPAGQPTEIDLYRRLRQCVCDGSGREDDELRLVLADSKVLYSPARGIGLLERGVLAMLALVKQVPSDWRSAWQLLDGESAAHLEHLPWHLGYDSALPHAANRDDVLAAADRLRDGLAGAGVRLVSIRSAALFPQPFNAGTERWGNKAEALSRWTLGLVAEALEGCPAEDVYVVCDKHGGRNFYGRLLQQHFPDYLIEVHGESLARSTYRWGPPEQRVEVRFCAGGESYLPVAAASMVSKYLRELAMQAFNDFWCRHVPSLRRTAGYPGDALRFKQDIASMQHQLGIDDRMLWRQR